MDFLNHREGGVVFYQGFLLSPFTVYVNRDLETVRVCVGLTKNKSQGTAVEVSVNSKEENS